MQIEDLNNEHWQEILKFLTYSEISNLVKVNSSVNKAVMKAFRSILQAQIGEKSFQLKDEHSSIKSILRRYGEFLASLPDEKFEKKIDLIRKHSKKILIFFISHTPFETLSVEKRSLYLCFLEKQGESPDETIKALYKAETKDLLINAIAHKGLESYAYAYALHLGLQLASFEKTKNLFKEIYPKPTNEQMDNLKNRYFFRNGALENFK